MGIRRRELVAGTACALLGCGAAAQSKRAARIETECARRRIPGVAVARLKRGRLAVLEAYGDLTVDTYIEVASLSKPVFAFAAIVESFRGLVDLDAPLARLSSAPYLHMRSDGVDAFDDHRLTNVTPRLLLSHQAGLPNWSRRAALTLVDDPGAGWRYSGEGYVLLANALEQKTKEPLDAWVRRVVFEPLAMQRSTFNPFAIPRRSEGHDRYGAPMPSSLRAPTAATSLVTTARDYAKFVQYLLNASQGDRVVDAMLTRQVDVDNERGIGWGLGLAIADFDWFFHWGANPGFRSLVVGSRGRGECVLIVTNSEAGMELAANIAREQFGDLAFLTFPMMYPHD